jgi:hypothetical protein
MSLPVLKGKPTEKVEGGAFHHVPLCRTPSQVGCIVTYAAFRASAPPPANSLFGHVAGESMVSACTNPANLAGGAGELHAYLDAAGHPFTSSTVPLAWTAPAKRIDTAFVSVPGLLTAQCVSDDHGSYLAVSVHGDPSDPRADDIPGDMKTEGGAVNPAWGLHLVDVNLTIGNLVDLVHEQVKAYRAKRPTSG